MSDRSLVDRFVSGPVAAVRPWLFAKAVYVLLALDVWHTLVGPAWRYGAAGFNVAHFAVLDALPIPTREAYVGNLVVVGALAFVAATLARTPRWLSAAITVLYTWGWSCSMLDSYQHHYLVSVLLFAICFFPRVTAVDLFGDSDKRARAVVEKRAKKAAAPVAMPSSFPHGLVARVRSLGWTLIVSFSGIVYAFTAVSKTEPEWRSGEALQNITHDGDSIRDVVALMGSIGIDASTLFHLMGSGVIVVQIVCSLGYLTASLRDGESTQEERSALDACIAALAPEVTRVVVTLFVAFAIGAAIALGLSVPVGVLVAIVGSFATMPGAVHRFLFAPLGRPKPLSILASVALLLALSFHLGAEYIGLQIGWFSYYMIILALVALTPAHGLAGIAALVTSPWRSREPGFFTTAPVIAPVLGMAAAGMAVYGGIDIDLPGSYEASIAIGIAAFALGIGAMFRADQRVAFARAALALGVAMFACWVSMTHGEERYDFYRFSGGDFRRRGEYVNALEDYREANRYAPPDVRGPNGEVIQSFRRDDRIEEMQAAIRREGL